MASEYEQLIKNLEQRFAKKKETAKASAIGESIRRGGVGGNLETGLRQAAATPIEEAEASTISGVLATLADKRREERLIGEGRQFQTGEREAVQRYGTGEREAGQRYGTQERFGRQAFGTSERLGTQQFQSQYAGERELAEAISQGYVLPGSTSLGDRGNWIGYEEGGQRFYGGAGERARTGQREFNRNIVLAREGKPKKRQWYEGAVSGLAGGVGTGAGYYLGGRIGGQ